MLDAQLNYFDMAVIAIMAISAGLAFFRGFVKEILSLIAWVGAWFVTVYFFKDVAESLKPYFTRPEIAAVCATIVLYLSALIGFAIVNRIIIKILKSGEIGMLDNLLGMAFGAVRGAIIIAIGFFMITLAIPENSRPQWISQAKTLPYVEEVTLLMAKAAPDYLKELSNLRKKAEDNVRQSGLDRIDDEVMDTIKDNEYNRTIDIPSVGDINQKLKDAGNSQKDNFNDVIKNMNNR
ncbi:MAG: CvpA family protein [Rickettsiales bacterium]